MRLATILLAGAAATALASAAGPASAADPIGKGLVMYMQMGGNPATGRRSRGRRARPRRPPL